MRGILGLPLGRLSKPSGRRLFYMFHDPAKPEPVSRKRAEVAKLRAMSAGGYGRFYMLFAESAAEARERIATGRPYPCAQGVTCIDGSTYPPAEALMPLTEEATPPVDPKELRQMERRIPDMGFPVYVDWSYPHHEGGQVYYPLYRATGDALDRLFTRAEILRLTRPEEGETEQMELFGLLGDQGVYDKTDLNSAIDAARRLIQAAGYSEPLYVYETEYGFSIRRNPAPWGQPYYVVHPSGAIARRSPVDTGLQGRIMNCGLWQPVHSPHLDKVVWRCLKYGRACDPETCTVPELSGLAGKLMTCIQWHETDPIRCAKYEQTCSTGVCLPEALEKPVEELPSEKEIRKLARSMAAEANALYQETGPILAREILSRGGIAPYGGGELREEYRRLPLHLKNRKGLPLDEMADEIGTDEAGLIAMIQEEYSGRKKKRRYKAEEFYTVARDMLMEEVVGLEGLGISRSEAEQVASWM